MKPSCLHSLAVLLLAAGPAVAQPAPEPAVPCEAIPPECLVASCADPFRWRVDVEYLRWWIKEGPIPGPLVTLDTRVLYGDAFDYNGNSGIRFGIDLWLNREQTLGVQTAGFLLETHTVHYEANANRAGSPLLARPFFNVLTNQEDAQVITAPNTFAGGIDIFSDSRLWGGEANLLRAVGRAPNARADLLVGFRYLGMKDDLRFSQASTLLDNGRLGFLGAVVLPPDIISITDRFHTHNQFYGGQVGLRGEVCRGRWSLESLGKIGIGGNEQIVEVIGSTLRTNSAGQTQAAPGGLYAQPSNLGRRTDGQFSWVSEVGLRLSCRVVGGLRAHVGYTFLYWDNVARPGDQIDRGLDPRQVASSLLYDPARSTPRPFPLLRGTDDFFAQGLNLGMEWRY